MVNRIGVLRAAIALAALGSVTAPPAQAETAKSWCMTYCDAIHLGCKKTLGLFDQEACDEWKQGCMDGCRVND